jgi:hypothetical protein
MELDLEAIGKRFKEVYGGDGVAADGRKYSSIPDKEIASMYIRKNGVDKAYATLGLEDPKKTQEGAKAAATLRQKLGDETTTKSYQELKKQWDNMQSAGDGGAGDISVMYSYIKMLDPTTAVREGELSLAAKAAGLPDKFIKAAKQLDKGAGLGPDIRKQMIAEGASIYNNVAKEQQRVNAFYEGLAKDSGVEPEKVLGSVGEVKLADVPEVKVAGGDEKTFTQKLGEGIYNTGKAVVEPLITTGKNISLLGQVLSGKAVGAVDPQLGAKIASSNTLGGISQANKIAENPQGAVAEQIGASVELALPKLLKMAGPAIRGGTKATKSVIKGATVKGASEARMAVGEAAKKAGIKLPGKLRLDAAKQALSEATEDEIPYLQKIFDRAKITSKKDIDPVKGIKLLVKVGGKAFNKSGTVKGSASAAYNSALRETLREEFKKKIPEVINQTDKIRKAKGVEKIIKTLKFPAAVGATSALLNIFTGSKD